MKPAAEVPPLPEGCVEDAQTLAALFFEACPWAGLVVEDRTLRILAANAAASRLYGLTRRQLCQATYAELAGDPAPAWEGRAFHRMQDAGECELEIAGGTVQSGGRVLRALALQRVDDEWERGLSSGLVEMMVGRQALEPILSRIVETLGRRFPELLPAVLLLHDGRLSHAAADRLPSGLRTRLDGLPIDSAAAGPSRLTGAKAGWRWRSRRIRGGKAGAISRWHTSCRVAGPNRWFRRRARCWACSRSTCGGCARPTAPNGRRCAHRRTWRSWRWSIATSPEN